MFKSRSRKLPFLIAGSLAASLLTFGAMPAQAADLGTVTVTTSGPLLVFSPPVVSGSVGDTFTVLNNSRVSLWPTLDGMGSVRVGATVCNVGQATCSVNDTASRSYTIISLGAVTFTNTISGQPPGGFLTIQQSGSGDDEKAAWLLANPTFDATANSNGGTCTGTTSWQRVPYIAAFQGVFTLPTASECTRAGYQLLGWATAANASKADFAAGSTFTMGNSNVTLFAVWSINGVLITYDANVGLDAQCLTGSNVNLVTLADRRSMPTVVPAGSATATQAPCTPPGHTLTGWSLTAGDPQTLVKGAALPASFTGTSQTLYAKWEPDRFGLSVQVGSLTVDGSPLKICAGVEQVVTFTATKNRDAVAGQVIDVEISRTGASSTSERLMTDDSGRVQVNFKVDPNYSPQFISGSFADQNIRFMIVEKDRIQCAEKSIIITGERTTVGGKSGITVNGTTTGFKKGDTVVPYIRFPGQTVFTAGSARPKIDADGSFSWQRKTGERVTVLITDDGLITSNRVTIQTD